jgi:hypothetical protein
VQESILVEEHNMRSHLRTSVSFRALALAGLLGGAALILAASPALAQVDQDQSLDARRNAILAQDQIFTDDGEVVDQDSVQVPAPLTFAPAVSIRTSDGSSRVQTVGWRNRYYGRPYGAYYYGPPRARYYSGYRGYYGSPYRYYGDAYYGGYGYGYRGGYYGTPRVGYYDGYYGGGAVRVGPLRVGWR